MSVPNDRQIPTMNAPANTPMSVMMKKSSMFIEGLTHDPTADGRRPTLRPAQRELTRTSVRSYNRGRHSDVD
jgi:hypothetical protein